MTPNPAYWAAHCAAFSDGYLLRFVIACENSRERYAAALGAATAEARRRNLIPNEKDPAVMPGPVTGRRKT
jgi:hypothetical protein